MAREISNSDDIIDSRDVIERIEELEAEKASYEGRMDDWQANADAAEELEKLLALQAEAEGYAPDWRHGAQLIRDTYFVDYCQELCADIGDVPKDMPGYLVIDWEATARNIKFDYTEVDFDGVLYQIR